MFANVMCKPQSSILNPNIRAESLQTRDPKTLHFGASKVERLFLSHPPIMENQMERKWKMKWIHLCPFKGVYRDIPPYNGESNGKENGK